MLACAVLFAILALTFGDVVGRQVLDKPITGALEITENLLAVFVFVSLPLASRWGKHVTIDLLAEVLPNGPLAWFDRIANLLTAGVLAAAVPALFKHAVWLRQDHAITPVLHLAIWPVVMIMSLAFAIVALVHFLFALGIIQVTEDAALPRQGAN